MTSQDISEALNRRVLIVTMTVSIVFVIFRSIARWVKVRRFPYAPEDIAMYVALSAFIIQCALYLAAMPTLYNALAIEAGLMPPYASLPKDLVAMLKMFLSVLIFFWLTLWAVKCSLLFMFKPLTKGLPAYERVWWCVLALVVLTFIGTVISDFTSCHSMHAWFTAGLCTTPRDATAKAASLWYALAVDLLTDLLIMALPLRLLWNLRISFQQKFAVGIVFTVGIITMIFAIVRSVSLDGTTTAGQVSTQWLILWGAIEGMVAILVGCLPAFAIFVRGRVEASRAQYGSYPSGTQSSRPTKLNTGRSKDRARAESVQLQDVDVEGDRGSSWGGESKKSLVDGSEGVIKVQRSWSQRWHTGSVEETEEQRHRGIGV